MLTRMLSFNIAAFRCVRGPFQWRLFFLPVVEFLIFKQFLHEIGLTATTLIEFENSFLRREHQVRFYLTEFVIFSITFVVFSHITVSPEI